MDTTFYTGPDTSAANTQPGSWGAVLAGTFPRDAEAGGGLMVAVVQLAITLGATCGGILFDGIGYQATFTASACVLGIAALLAFVTQRLTRQP
ncbi:MFS transporter [Acetobacter persici]|uniref:hypothetical protein n=1 Tax=Acetobacter persici TaxID=1076596 RepID=UPI0020CF5613|nr:hypothetical protein [Acetobacter persici]MCP9318276.1 MFS transporter [Acetobacter persici]